MTKTSLTNKRVFTRHVTWRSNRQKTKVSTTTSYMDRRKLKGAFATFITFLIAWIKEWLTKDLKQKQNFKIVLP